MEGVHLLILLPVIFYLTSCVLFLTVFLGVFLLGFFCCLKTSVNAGTIQMETLSLQHFMHNDLSLKHFYDISSFS